jgi:hypothetical protein
MDSETAFLETVPASVCGASGVKSLRQRITPQGSGFRSWST